MCHASVSRQRDSVIAVLSGCVPTWKAHKAQLLIGGHEVGKLGFCHFHSHYAAVTSTVGPKALPRGEQNLSYQSMGHDGEALVLLFQFEAPQSELVCVYRCIGSTCLLIACTRYPRLQLVFCFQLN